jgi:hypothetical protein
MQEVVARYHWNASRYAEVARACATVAVVGIACILAILILPFVLLTERHLRSDDDD